MLKRFVILVLMALAGSAFAQALTPAQLITVRAAVIADPTAAAFRAAGDAFSLKAWLNEVPVSGAVQVWRTEAPVVGLINAINWALYTPSAALDDASIADALTAARRQAQLLSIQTKQINLQSFILARDRLDCSPANVRAGLRDAVIQVPSGTNGAAVSPGGGSGATTLAACVRGARRAEGFLAGADSTTGSTTAKLLVYEGQVNDADVSWIINN